MIGRAEAPRKAQTGCGISEAFGLDYCLPAVPGLFPPNFDDPVPLKVVGPPAVPFGLFDPAEWCMWWRRLCVASAETIVSESTAKAVRTIPDSFIFVPPLE